VTEGRDEEAEEEEEEEDDMMSRTSSQQASSKTFGTLSQALHPLLHTADCSTLYIFPSSIFNIQWKRASGFH
jgi:hypothetical protein